MEFRFEYEPGTIRYGKHCVTKLGEELERLEADRALVITGQTVGATDTVMNPIREGLGERLVSTFAETTPEKTLPTALRGAKRVAETGADALVAVGGGSSLDITKIIAAVADTDRTDEEIIQTFEETGSVPIADGELRPIVAVPTTLAGADLSMIGGVTLRREGLIRGGVHDPRLMPDALWYDPELFRTTPHDVLCASAMNGFDKAIETVYADTATPITDGTAVRALGYLSDGLPRLGSGEWNDSTMRDVVLGTILAQYGCSRVDGLTLSLIHAFGHGIARGYNIQQGGAHGIIAPHALAYLFGSVDGKRTLLADGLGVEAESRDATADAVIEAVENVRDALGLPTRLREIDDMVRSDLPSIAADVYDDGLMPYCPSGLDPTIEELEDVLSEAW
ncbi:MAG: iron-containing alcohol dehydrogenase family protein [Natronomonas sp.]